MSLLLASVLLLGCTEPEEAEPGTTLDLGEGPDELVLPDISDVDLPAVYVEALALAKTITLDSAWSGHETSMARRTSTCPDLYVGGVEEADNGDDPEGLTWWDYCQPGSGGAAFGGWMYWDGGVAVDGDENDAAGRSVTASRELSGDGLVSIGSGDETSAAFEFRGEASESVYVVTAPDYTTWTWSSLVEATVTGSDAFSAGSLTADGFRAELYLDAAGGESPTLDLRGAAYLFAPRIADRFDSIDMELSFGSDLDCELEPRGWISLRDEDAFWFDLVFGPLEDGTGDTYENEGYDSCDGCGTLYIRGLETVEYGEVCPDFTSTWAVGDAAVPDPGDFLLTLREVMALEGG